MTVLVTGGAGYIGSIVVQELLRLKNTVVVVDSLRQGHRQAVLPEAIFCQADYGDRQLMDNVFGNNKIDAVLHFAGEATVEFSMTDPERYFRNNVVNGITLLEAMRHHGCKRLVFSSTAAIFGEPQYIAIDEKHPQLPINAYGASKLMFEQILDWYHRAYGLKFNAFRYFNAAGASGQLGEDHRPESHLIPLVLKRALFEMSGGGCVARSRKNSPATLHSSKGTTAATPLKVFGNDYLTRDGTCIRDYVHVLDLARAHILALENLDQYPDRRYNLGNGQGFTVLEVIKTARKVTGVNIPYEFAPRRPEDPSVLIASSELAQKELGWNPQFHDLESIVRSAWDWHRWHPGGYGDK